MPHEQPNSPRSATHPAWSKYEIHSHGPEEGGKEREVDEDGKENGAGEEECEESWWVGVLLGGLVLRL